MISASEIACANSTFNLGLKDFRFLRNRRSFYIWSDLVLCSNENGNFIGAFNGSYDSLRDKPEISQPNYYEVLSFSPDKSLTLIAARNNLISSLNLETTGPLSWFTADRIICTEMSKLNGPISQVETPELSHKAANKSYVDNRFIAYTPTEQMINRFQSFYARKSDL